MEEFDQLFDDELFNIEEVDEKTLKLKEGERRMVSILFADIKGFTSMSEKLDHEEVQSVIDKLMKIFSHSVEVFGGYVDKYTGDQIMALFGAKHASEVDTQRSINAGLDMLSKLEKFNLILKNSPKFSELNINLSIRVGINTGMVTTGAIGKEREGDYTVYGDAVNLAARMESNAPINSIMIPEDTKILVDNFFAFNDEGKIEVKGKSKPISVFTVLSNKDVEVIHETPFLGRESELGVLNNAYNDSLSNFDSNKVLAKIHFIGISADAGTGKSRLVHEFLKDNNNIQADTHYSIGFATNVSNKPYYIFTTLIKDIFKISEIDNVKAAKEKLQKGITDLKSNYNHDLLDSALPFIGFLIGIKYDDKRLLDRSEFKNHMHISIKSLIEAVCQFANLKSKPYLIILDDLHWIDKLSIDLLVYMLATFNVSSKRDGSPLSIPFFVSTYRTEFSPPKELEDAVFYNKLDLKPLSREVSRDLIDKLLLNIEIEQNKKIELLEKSKGNPFFIEEWVSLVKESHSFTEPLDESRGIGSNYSIPNSLNALILARIDSLQSDLKVLLQKATIIGEDFFVQILSKLEKKLGLKDEIQSPINNLEKEDFIKHFINQLDHYRFKHILTRDVAYSTILKSNKKILHSAVAEIIEENFSDKLDLFYFDLAIHYDISEKHDQAIKFLSLAGEKNIIVSDYVHAEQCFNRLIDIISNNKPYSDSLNSFELPDISDGDKSVIKTYIESKKNLGKIYLNIGKWDLGIEILEDALNKLKHIDWMIEFEINFTLGKIYNLKRMNDKSKSYFMTCLSLSKEHKDKLNYAYTIGELSDLEFDIGNTDNALKGFMKQLEIANELKDDKLLQSSYLYLGMVYLQNGDLDTSLRFYKKLYDLATKYDSKQQILQALGNISLIHNIRGEYDQSLSHFKEVISISEDIHDLRNQAMTYGNQGIIYKNLKKYNVALDNYNLQLQISRQIGDKWMESNALDGIALVYQKTGKFDESISHSKESIKIKQEIKDMTGSAKSMTNLSSTYIKKGELDKSIELLEKSLDIQKSVKNERSQHLILLEMSKVYFFQKDYSKASDTLSPVVDYFIGINDLTYASESLVQLSQSYRFNNNAKKAKEILVGYQIKTNAHKYLSSIELYLSNLSLNNELDVNKLNELLKNDESSKEIETYIYFNIAIISNQETYVEKSKQMLSELFEATNDYKYKFNLSFFK